MRRLAAMLLTACALAAPAAAGGFMEVFRADAALDLASARKAALACVHDHPESADAVAVAAWWLDNIEVIPEPDEILGAAGPDPDPELGFVLARIESTLLRRPPRGVLATVELSGPFGSFGRLDLERDVVPADGALPPPGTPWRGPAEPFRLSLRTADGTVRPPDPFLASGVYLAAWTLEAGGPLEGWLVVEAIGGYNLELDGGRVAAERDCGRLGAGTRWYRLRLRAGRHRLRVVMGSQRGPRVRVSLLDPHGRALPVKLVPGAPEGPWAGAVAGPALPPAERRVRAGGDGPAAERALLAARLAALRDDPLAERRWLERAASAAPEAPEPQLALAGYFLQEPTGAAAEVDYRRCRAHLEQCRTLPMAGLLRRSLDLRQRRAQDAENDLDALVEGHSRDPRVLRLWVGAAVKRGWVREAQEALARLRSTLPGSPWVSRLQLQVDRVLERWQDRNRVLESIAAADPLAPDTVDLLVAAARSGLALGVLRRQGEVMDNPRLDLGIARLLAQLGRADAAGKALAATRDRWGDWPGTDRLAVVLAAGRGDEALGDTVRRVLERRPSDLELRSLAWRHGLEPFFEPFRVNALQIAAAHKTGASGVDSELILDQAVERVFADGSSLYYYHGLTRALTPDGAKEAASIPLLPGALLLRVRIIKADGTVVVPPEVSADARQMDLKEVEPGDMVEHEYVAPVAPTGASHRGHMSPYIYRFADPNRVFGRSEYVLLVPPAIHLDIDGNFEGLEHEDKVWHGLHLLSWRATDVAPPPEEPFSPPNQQLLPWVSYGFGVSWRDVGDSIRDRVLPALAGSPELWTWASSRLADAAPAAAVGRLLDALVDRVEAGDTEMTVRRTAGQSFSLKRGNRLGITAAVLIHAGWRVDLVMTRPLAFAGTGLKVPTFDAFPVPVLRVEKNGVTVWIDTTEGRRGAGHIRPVLQGSDGYVLPLSDPSAPVRYLEKLPRFPNPGLEERVGLDAAIGPSGAADATYTITLRGAQGERLYRMVDTVPRDRVETVYQQVAARLFPGAEVVDGSVERRAGGVVLTLRFRLPDACTRTAAGMECRSLVLARPLSPRLASLPSRHYPLVLDLPILQRLELVLHAPPGWTPRARARRLETRWGEVTEEVSAGGGTLRSVLELRIPAQVVSPADYPGFVRFCHAVDESMSRPPVLVPKGRGRG